MSLYPARLTVSLESLVLELSLAVYTHKVRVACVLGEWWVWGGPYSKLCLPWEGLEGTVSLNTSGLWDTILRPRYR